MSSLSLADVAWSTPDGRPVFSHLSLDFARERTGLVGRNGVGKSTLLRLLSGDLAPGRGRVIRAGTVGTLRQGVRFAPDETIADLMGVARQLDRLRRAEAGAASLDDVAQADWTLEARASEALSQVGLDTPLETRLIALSGGQRTRAALAGAVFARPDFLLLDEPTNDLDRDGRRAVGDLLAGWRAGAIVVSHDRDLLEAMDAIVELSALGAARYGGNWSAYRERKALELAATEQDLMAAEQRISQARRKAQEALERQQKRNAAGARKAARGDMPRVLAGARRDRAEKSGGANARLAEARRTSAEQTAAEAKGRVERVRTLSFALAPTGLASGQRVLDVRDLTFGYAPRRALLRRVNLALNGPERVALAGANGAGKSTLLALVTGALSPWSGQARTFTPFAHFDQRMALLDPAASIVENFARLNRGMDEQARRAALARFEFRAEAADRAVDTLSGGQVLRAALACVLGGATAPPLLILDEPTNHLDLDSIAAVEAALRAYDGALLVASHDDAFLEAIGVTRSVAL